MAAHRAVPCVGVLILAGMVYGCAGEKPISYAPQQSVAPESVVMKNSPTAADPARPAGAAPATAPTLIPDTAAVETATFALG